MTLSRIFIPSITIPLLCLLAPVVAQDEAILPNDGMTESTQQELLVDILEKVEETSTDLDAFRGDVDKRFSKIEEDVEEGFDRIQKHVDDGFDLVGQRFDLVEHAARNEATNWALKAFIPASLLGGFIGAGAFWFSQRGAK